MREKAEMTPEERARWMRVGMLSALAMVLGYLETFVPIPIPGVKLGLANIAVLVALSDGDIGGAFCIGAIKVLTVGLLFGNPVTLSYSALGTLLAFAVMAPLSKLQGAHVVTVSAAGALAHVVGQLIVASALLGTPLVWYSLPPLEIAAGITGILSGIVTSRALVALDSTDKLTNEAEKEDMEDALAPKREGGGVSFGLPSGRPTHARVSLNPKVVLVGLIAFMVFVFSVDSAPLLAGAMVLAAIACAVGRVSTRQVLWALRPMLLIIAITFIAQMASFQVGEVAARLGPIVITFEALRQTGIMAARLVSVVGASVAVMQLVDLGNLVDAIRWIVRPLGRLGIRTEGFCLALEVALASVPAVLSLAKDQSWNWRELGRSAPEFIARAISREQGTEECSRI